MLKTIAKIAAGSVLVLSSFASQAGVFTCNAKVDGDLKYYGSTIRFDLVASPGGWALDGGYFNVVDRPDLLIALQDAIDNDRSHSFYLYHDETSDKRCSDNDEGPGRLVLVN